MPSRTKLLTQIFISLPAVFFASCLVAASAAPSNARACASVNGPSKLDYLVLASIADSPHLLAMSGYRSTAEQRSDFRPHPANYLEAAHRLNTAAQRRGHVLANNSGN
jgi:beta-phosphoglucomutase-like phosphatase (HAD superfamily)